MAKPRRKLLAAIICLALVSAVFLLWPKKSHEPLVRLELVRQGIEQGRPVAYFRVRVADSRRIQITYVEKILANAIEGPFAPEAAKPATNFWAPSQVWPLGDPRKGRKEFGVIIPSEPTWQLRVNVSMETPSELERLKQMPRLWWATRGIRSMTKTPFLSGVWQVWTTFYSEHSEVMETDLRTNSAPSTQAGGH